MSNISTIHLPTSSSNHSWFQLSILSLAVAVTTAVATAAPDPLRILLITGGCCHDYVRQQDILRAGLEQRINAQVTIIYCPDRSYHPPLPILGNPNYASGYDVVIHDYSAAEISDPAVINAVLQPHRDGLPGVNLHGTMHAYRIGNPKDPVTLGTPHGLWFEYLGLQSIGHGPKEPISIHFTDSKSPITKRLTDWMTIQEELYNPIRIFETAHVLAHGVQVVKQPGRGMETNNAAVVWTNEYGPKRTRIFSTTIGHNNETVEDARYLDLVSRGVLWATGHLNEDGTPAPGFGKNAR
jgi:hypothetical protein